MRKHRRLAGANARLSRGIRAVAVEALENRIFLSGNPTASLNAATMTSSAATYQFTVTYTASSGANVEVSNLDSSNVIVAGPDNYAATATFVSASSGTNSSLVTATYSITAPGNWSSSDDGVYTASMQASQVSDSSGAYVAAGSLGTFDVDLAVGSSSTRGYNDLAIANWDTVPYQTLTSETDIGVVAFQYNGIASVDFSVNNGPWTIVTSMTKNQQTGVSEYCLPLQPSDYADGAVTIQAVAVPSTAGTPRVLPVLTEYADSNNSLPSQTLWVSTTGSDTTGNGTEFNPYASVLEATSKATDGTTIYLESGTYGFGINYYTSEDNQRWITIEAAPGLSSANVTVIPSPNGVIGRLQVNHLALDDVSISCSSGEDIYHNGGSLYLNDCNLYSPLGAHYLPELAVPIYGFDGCTEYVIDTSIHDYPGSTLDNITLARGDTLYNIGGHAFDNPVMVVNCTINNVFADNPGDHTDSIIWYPSDLSGPTIDANSIVYGVVATDEDTQLLFGQDVSNIAIVNYLAIESQGGLNAFQMCQFNTGTINQILLNYVTLPNEALYFASAGDDNAANLSDISIQNSVFWLLMANDPTDETISNCHIIAPAAYGNSVPNFGTYTTGDAGFTDPAAGDYSPAPGSVLLDRVAQPLIAADAYNLPRTATDDAIGAVEPEADNARNAASDQSPQITSANNATFSVGASSSFTVTTTGTPLAAISTADGAGLTSPLPVGLSFIDNGNGTASIYGDPASGSNGVYDIQLAAMNGVNGGVTQTFTLTVNTAPTISSVTSAQFTTGISSSFAITTTGTPIAALQEIGALPLGLSFTDNGNGTAKIFGTPAAAAGGVYDFSLLADNGSLPNATQSFVLTVQQAPRITSNNSAQFTVGSAGSFQITSTAYPIASLHETVQLPDGLIFTDNGNGTAILSGTPTAGTGGVYDLSLAASVAGLPIGTQSFTLTVDQAPSITNASTASFTVGSSGSFIFTTDGFPVPTLTETSVLPAGVTFTDNGEGSATLSGSPADGTAQTYELSIVASNGILPAVTQTFTLTVANPPTSGQGPIDQPIGDITSAAGVNFAVGLTNTFLVTTTGDPTPALSEQGDLPAGLTFTDNGNGTATLSGVPDDSSAGDYTLTFVASNGHGTPSTQTFSLDVATAPPIAVANASGVVSVDNPDGSVRFTITPFPAMSGIQPSVTVGQINGVTDIITAAGPGEKPMVKIYDGQTGELISKFEAFPTTFKGGLSIAFGAVEGSGSQDIIVGKATIAPRVKIFDATTNAVVANWIAYPTNNDGVTVAAADLSNDGFADVLTVQNGDVRPKIKIVSGQSLAQGTPTVLSSFFPFAANYNGPVSLATGDLNDDGTSDIIVGQLGGASPHMRVYDGTDNTLIQNFWPFDKSSTAGIQVSSIDLYGNGQSEIVAAQNGMQSPTVDVLSGTDDSVISSFN